MPGVSEDQHEGMRWNAVSKRAEQAVRTEFTGAQWYWTSRLLSGFFFSPTLEEMGTMGWF